MYHAVVYERYFYGKFEGFFRISSNGATVLTREGLCSPSRCCDFSIVVCNSLLDLEVLTFELYWYIEWSDLRVLCSLIISYFFRFVHQNVINMACIVGRNAQLWIVTPLNQGSSSYAGAHMIPFRLVCCTIHVACFSCLEHSRVC